MSSSVRDTTALITGATSGIGLEFARVFAKSGRNVVLVARDEDALQQLSIELQQHYNVTATPIAVDLFEPGAAEELYQDVKDRGITVDILVNDAGQGEHGKFWETDLQRHLDIIQLNITSLTVLTQLFLKDMVARNDGKILQLASVVSKMPSPLLGVYAATKAYVYSLTHALINELKDTNVTMTALMPGATDTDFFHKAGSDDTKVYEETELSDPKNVAQDGYDALMAGKSHVVSGFKNKAQVAMTAVMSEASIAEQGRKQNEPSDKAQPGGPKKTEKENNG